MIQSLYAITIFISAFLIFFIQPLLAKSLLPSFGGSVFVWVVSMLFFQFGLLLGYTYAYGLSKLTIRKQCIWHGILFALSFIYIRNTLPEYDWQTLGWPPYHLFMLLCGKILIPFVILSATSPLLQSWYCRIKHTTYPYYYYAVSNAGSLLGLFCFPLLFEWLIGLKTQMQTWNSLYCGYALLTLACAIPLLRSNVNKQENDYIAEAQKTTPIPYTTIAKWLSYTFLSSAFMLATTNYILQNIINMPLIWILPLALFLISYIVTFAHEKTYQKDFWILSIAIWLLLLCWSQYHHIAPNNLLQGTVVILALQYSCCMLCHGELVQLKPANQHLTFFYLMIALGGVLGGLFVTIGGYWLFNDLWDYYIPLLIIALMGLVIIYYLFQANRTWYYRFAVLVSAFSIAAFSFVSIEPMFHKHSHLLEKRRNAYGLIRVWENFPDSPEHHRRRLVHGPILHGAQFLADHKRHIATTYYGTYSGIGLSIAFLKEQFKKPLDIAVVGLGTGTIAALINEQDSIDFYDIDEDVIEMSQSYFSFIRDSKARCQFIKGDGRLELNKKQAHDGNGLYDIIALDAFNGDSIPFHLITKEAITLYQKLLKPNGIIAFHISNKFVNLSPVTKALAQSIDWPHYHTITAGDEKLATNAASWALISSHPHLAEFLYDANPNFMLTDKKERLRLWTDEHNSMLPILSVF